MSLKWFSIAPLLRQLNRFQLDDESNLTHVPQSDAVLRPAAELLYELQVHQIQLEMQNETLRESQVALEASRERYANLYDFAPVAYLTISNDGLIMDINHTGATMFGLGRSKLINHSIEPFVAIIDRDRWQRQFSIAMAHENVQSFDLTLVRMDRSECSVQVRCLLQESLSGMPTLQLSMMDITERKRAENIVERERLRFQTILKMASDGIHILDSKGLLVEANEAFLTMLGYDQSIVGKMRVEDWDLLDQYPTPQERIENVIAQQGHEIFETRNRRRDGSILDIEVNLAGIQIEGKGYVYAAARDITKRKRLEHLLKEKNIELENSKLVAENANSAKSEFLASMSHELRTPLNAILGFAQLIEASTTPAAKNQKQSIDQILKAGWHLLSLINEILDLAKIESGKMNVAQKSVSLPELLADCHAMIEPQAQNAGIHLTFPHFDNPCHVLGDIAGIKQVMLNLLSNAIKYNRVGGQVTVTCTMNDERRLRIRIEDSGAGIAPEQLSQLFQPFNRLGQECGMVEGTGIGLVITKRLVMLMGGTIGVESRVDVGSVFWFELEAASQPQASLNKLGENASHEHGSDQSNLEQLPRTLLYIEDNAANLAFIATLITTHTNLNLLTAINGQQGIQRARESQPDLILMDINLPGISGFDVLKALREDTLTTDIPVMALSANAMAHDIQKGLQAGFVQYITKPIKVDELINAINLTLES